jgi:hypothetical protein
MFRRSWIIAGLILAGLPLMASAHQPRLVSHALTTVKNPEISQAFYAELSGQPQSYRFTATQPLALYAGLLVPDIVGERTDITATISRDGQLLATLDGRSFPWSPYYEKYGGDYYLWGPEFAAPGSSRETGIAGQTVPPGTYTITVSDLGNSGKYVLALGAVEAFPPTEIIKTLFLVPQLKAGFFAYSPGALFSSIYVWLYLIFWYALAFLGLWWLRRSCQKFFKTRHAREPHNLGLTGRLSRALYPGSFRRRGD